MGALSDWAGRRDGQWSVEGVDLFPTHPAIRRGDMERLPFASSEYDLVYCAHVLEHAHDLRRAAREIARVTMPNGYVWLAVPKGYAPTAHDRWRFDGLNDLARPFVEAGAGPEFVVGVERENEVCGLLRLRTPQGSRRVVVALPDARVTRDWAASGLLAMLGEKGWGVVALVPSALVDQVRDVAPAITVEPWEPHAGSRWVRWIRRWPLRTLSFVLRARWDGEAGEAYRHKLDLRTAKRQRLGIAVARLVTAPLARINTLSLERVLRFVSSLLPTPRATRDLLRSFRPDVVVASSTVQEGAEAALIAHANRRGVRTIVQIASLDTLVSKGCLLARPDRLLVWGSEAYTAAVRHHDVSPAQVIATGPTQFDVYADVEKELGTEIIVAGSSTAWWPDQERVVQRLKAQGLSVYYRAHPRLRAEGWAWDADAFAERLRRCLCLVTAWSTTAVEAALLGKPVLLVDSGAHGRRHSSWPHIRPILSWPGVRVCLSGDELLKAIADLTEGRWQPDPKSQRTCALRVARADGFARQRIVEAIGT